MSINVSPRQLVETELRLAADRDRRRLRAWTATRILLEVTETTVMRDPEHAIAVLEKLKAQGMHICIDDFGTGYSSLSYLKRLPVETIKIDRSFVDGLGEDPEDTAIVRAVIGMADSLRLLCVAEGVETHDQVEALRALGCHIAQGFLFGHPLCVDRLAPFPRDDLSSWADTQVDHTPPEPDKSDPRHRQRGAIPQARAPGGARLQADQIGPRSQRVGGTGHGLDGDRLPAPARRLDGVGRIGHDVAEVLVHPHRGAAPGLGVVELDPGDTVRRRAGGR